MSKRKKVVFSIIIIIAALLCVYVIYIITLLPSLHRSYTASHLRGHLIDYIELNNGYCPGIFCHMEILTLGHKGSNYNMLYTINTGAHCEIASPLLVMTRSRHREEHNGQNNLGMQLIYNAPHNIS